MKRRENLLGRASLALFALSGAMAVLVPGTPLRPGSGMAAAATPAAPATDTTETTGAALVLASATDPAGAPDLAAGEKLFGKCKACHTADAGMKDRVGPHLWGVVNRPVAAVEGFRYSKPMSAHGGDWTPAVLDAYLADPKGYMPGNKMAFAGLRKPQERRDLIAWLAAQSDTPTALPAETAEADTAPAALPAEAGAVADTAPAAVAETAAAGAAIAATAAAEAAAGEIAQIPYTDPPAPGEDEIAAIAERLAALEAEIPAMDYERARHHPIHYPPMIDQASDAECLACHQEILTHAPRETSPAGVRADESLAWYQTLDTYVPQEGTGQSDFHWRHIASPLAQQTMNLQCNFCHRGNDLREESPDLMPLRAAFATDPASPEFTLRKMVNPSETCLRCHGAMPAPEEIMGLAGPWHEIRADMEDQTEDDPTLANGCLSCHAELFRTNRHNVTYLKAAGIEDLAQAGSDTCYGCHGGRAWYRISYPYARHPWPGMDPEIPAWAEGRPTTSDARYQRSDQ